MSFFSFVFTGGHAFAALRFVSFGLSQKKEPSGDGELRKDREQGMLRIAKEIATADEKSASQ